ncbi:hypothetical protein GCM10022197_39490 [Microlunatus spumicola]|uniref:DUF4240 domain-containing protein n=1 Tax=Microlunatus spumicola TaxID=81499 RepID=A0ABP6Y6M6_9ACTN
MDDVRFWSVVASLGPELAPARLALVLNSLTRADLGEFCAHLADAEGELDTRDHRSEAVTAFELEPSRGRRTEAEQRPADFEELQVTVVAHGLDAWRAVVAVPPLLSGGWPTGLGRQFLLAVANAWRRLAPELQPA